ncbi:MAG: baseplate J/gp47 family protein [Solirubrobacterales bacterium]
MGFYKSAETYYAEMTSTMTDVDVGKNSLIYNALMPCCYELSYQSLMLDEAVKMVFAQLAVENGYSDYIDLRCAEQGLSRKTATTATGTIKVTGIAGYTLPAGALVSTVLGLTYKTDAALTLVDTTGYVNITANESGSGYNAAIGDICKMPVAYEGITSITNEEAIVNGYDIETDEELYNRYLTKIQKSATSGNAKEYEDWALSITGCGAAKAHPLWNGNGTVKVVVANSNKAAADSTLVNAIAAYIETVRPIGATVTIASVVEVAINISMTLQYDTAYTLDDVKTNIQNAVKDYLYSVALNTTTISYNKILAIIMDADGVNDISNLLINSGTSSITINDGQVAVIGTVTCNVA